MYYGKQTKKIVSLRNEYEKIFGYDPDGEMSVEIDESGTELYEKLLEECVATKKDMFEVIGI